MKCRRCGSGDSRVLDSRPCEEGLRIRRRRACEVCGNRWTTYEVEESVSLMVLKKDGRREALDRDKLLRGIARACEKRPIAFEEIEAVADRIVGRLLLSGAREVGVQQIGESVLGELEALDPVAFVRFMSVYRQFSTADDFLRELSGLVNKQSPLPPHGSGPEPREDGSP